LQLLAVNVTSFVMHIGKHELPKEKYWWMEHWEHSTRLFWRNSKLWTDGCAISWSRFVCHILISV